MKNKELKKLHNKSVHELIDIILRKDELERSLRKELKIVNKACNDWYDLCSDYSAKVDELELHHSVVSCDLSNLEKLYIKTNKEYNELNDSYNSLFEDYKNKCDEYVTLEEEYSQKLNTRHILIAFLLILMLIMLFMVAIK